VEQVNAKLGHAAGGSQPCSFQLRVPRLGFPQDGYVGIGVFPKSEDVFVRSVPFGFIPVYSNDRVHYHELFLHLVHSKGH